MYLDDIKILKDNNWLFYKLKYRDNQLLQKCKTVTILVCHLCNVVLCMYFSTNHSIVCVCVVCVHVCIIYNYHKNEGENNVVFFYKNKLS